MNGHTSKSMPQNTFQLKFMKQQRHYNESQVNVYDDVKMVTGHNCFHLIMEGPDTNNYFPQADIIETRLHWLAKDGS